MYLHFVNNFKKMKKLLIKNMIAIAVLFAFNDGFAQSKSKVIVYRKGSPYGAFAKYQVIVDGKQMDVLKGSSTHSYELAPGSHTISPKQSKRAITLNTEAGKTYVIKYKNMLGLFGVRPKLKLLSLEEAKEDSKVVNTTY